MRSVHFEYLGEDIETPGATVWHVEAIHVTTTRNRRKFTKSELEQAGRSLSYRPLDINHDPERVLAFPENKTLHMQFNPEKMVVEGKISISDKETNFAIETKKIEAVSIEQIPTKETCNEILCEQHGVAFIGLGLLEKGVLPGDHQARITGHAESIQQEPIANMMVSDEQRTCKDCTDDIPCHTCFHKKQEFLRNEKSFHEEIKLIKLKENLSKEATIANAMSTTFDNISKELAWKLYESGSNYYDSL